ncbi:hypothetical protein BH23THE1_BH23THE1_09040 [soil metagenome]
MDDSTYQLLKKSKFYHPKVTEVIYDINQLEGMIAEAIYVVEKGFDMVWDKMMFNFHYNHLRDGYEAMERLIDEKHLKIRLIVEAIPENIDQINSITSYEIRHLDDIGGNFGILDERAYIVSIFHKGSTKPQQAFFSNSSDLIDKQQSLFDQLWEIAIPIETRTKELELSKGAGLKKKFENFDEIQSEIHLMMKHCKRELIIFSSINILRYFTRFDTFWKYCSVLAKRNVCIKLLIDDDYNSDLLNNMQMLKKMGTHEFIQIEYSSKLGSVNECTLIADGQSILKVNSDHFNHLIGTLSYDKNHVLVQEILFEKCWNEIGNLAITS